jgi:hypothetical protein
LDYYWTGRGEEGRGDYLLILCLRAKVELVFDYKVLDFFIKDLHRVCPGFDSLLIEVGLWIN